MSEALPPPGASEPPPQRASHQPAPPEWVGQALRRAGAIEEPLKRRLYLVAALTRLLEPRGIRPVVVGGTAMAWYTLGGYSTLDVDLVVPDREALGQALAALGFEHQPGHRHWYHPDLDVAIEAPDEVLAGSTERVQEIQVDGLSAFVIGLEDLVMDRLRAFVHWRSSSDGEWAHRLLAAHHEEVDWEYLRSRAGAEGLGKALERVARGRYGLRRHPPRAGR